MKRIVRLAIILLTLILTACTATQPPSTYTPMPPTATFTPIPEPTVTNTPRPTATPTPIPWRSYKMTYSFTRDTYAKLWMPIPKVWDGIGMEDVEILSITPEPDDLYEDVQGNLIAFWDSGWKGTAVYEVVYLIKLVPIKYEIIPDQIGEYNTSTWEYQRYTQPSTLIQSDNEDIISLAKQIIGNETNPYLQAKKIHKWVSSNISSGDINDAITTLETKSAGCGGHSWLFVALLRSLGIPARGLGGLHPMYQGDFKDGNPREGTMGIHIWSEFYLPGYGWIQSDTSAGTQNFAEINEVRIVLFRGEDIELGHGYPLGTIPWFHTPNIEIIGDSYPPTQTWGKNLTLSVERLP